MMQTLDKKKIPISLEANDFDNVIKGSKQGSYCANLENDCPFGRPVKSFHPAHQFSL